MTDELLKQANNLKHTIHDLEAQIAIVEDMHHSDNNLILEVDTIGAITIAWDDELKDDLLDIVLNRLTTKKEEVEDEYRRL